MACPSLFWLFFQCCCDVSSGLMRVITIVQLRRQFRANASRNSKWMLRLRRQIPAAVLTKVITPLQLRRLTRAHEIGSSEKARCPQEEEIAEQGKKCSVKSTESPGGVSFSLLALLPVLLRRQFRAHESYNYRAAATSVQGKCK